MKQFEKAVLTILVGHVDYLIKAAMSQNFTLAQPTHPFLALSLVAMHQ